MPLETRSHGRIVGFAEIGGPQGFGQFTVAINRLIGTPVIDSGESPAIRKLDAVHVFAPVADTVCLG